MSVLFFGSLAGFLFCAAFPAWIDGKLNPLGAAFAKRLREKFSPLQPESPSLPLLSRLLASLRAGVSLDAAVAGAAEDRSLDPGLRIRMRKVLEEKPGGDFLSSFLAEAIHTGMPALSTLTAFQRILQTERRVRFKAASLTSQSRAQGEVLSWLPWVMLAALALMDGEWFLQAGGSSAAWASWALALALLGLGRIWMKAVLSRALEPAGESERIEEKQLPELCLRMLAQLSLGRDAETALEESLRLIGDRGLQEAFAAPGEETTAGLKSLLAHSARTGAPLREDLAAFLGDLHLRAESRWEERVQRLPVVMMAPLFLCFFPSCLLVLVGLLLPLMGQW